MKKTYLLIVFMIAISEALYAQSDTVPYTEEKVHTSKFWRSTLKSMGVGFAATQVIPTGTYTYGVQPVTTMGFDIHFDFSEFVLHFLGYSAPLKEKKSHITVGTVFTFGNFGKMKNFHTVTSGDTTTSYSLINDLNVGQIYLEFEKTTKWLNPFGRVSYFLFEQNLKEQTKERIRNSTTNVTTGDSYLLTDELSKGAGITLGLKYRYNFKNNASVIVPLSVSYLIGSPIYTTDMKQVQIINSTPYYEVRKQTPQLVTVNATVCYNF